MQVTAIDPGQTNSAIVVWDGTRIIHSDILSNTDLLNSICMRDESGPLVLEWITGYGIPAGAETFDTCRWIGRFQQAYKGESYLLARRTIKQHFQAANDRFIRQALVDRFGEPGNKKAPGLLYGITSHKLAAFACAVCFFDLHAKI